MELVVLRASLGDKAMADGKANASLGEENMATAKSVPNPSSNTNTSLKEKEKAAAKTVAKAKASAPSTTKLPQKNKDAMPYILEVQDDLEAG